MAYKKFFPAQEDSEKVFLLIRRHWFTYSIFWILTFLMILPIAGILVVWLGGLIEITESVGSLIILGSSTYLLGLLAILLYGFVDYYLDVYIVTDRRIVDIKQNGFFRREISELYLQEVQDVNAKVIGFFPTVLHFGDVVIQTAGEVDNFFFSSVPHPYQISKTIMDLHENVIKSPAKRKKDGLEPKKYSEEELSRRQVTDEVIVNTKNFFSDKLEKSPPVPVKERNKVVAEKPEITVAPVKSDRKEKLSQTREPKKIPAENIKTEEQGGILEEGKQTKII